MQITSIRIEGYYRSYHHWKSIELLWTIVNSTTKTEIISLQDLKSSKLTDRINSLMSIKETEFLSENLSTNKTIGADGYPAWFKHSSVPKLSENRRERYTPNHFMRQTFLWHTQKKWLKVLQEKKTKNQYALRRTIILNKMLVNQIQPQIGPCMYRKQRSLFIPGIQSWFKIQKSINIIYSKRINKENHLKRHR